MNDGRTRLLGQKPRTLLLTSVAILRVSAFSCTSFPSPSFHRDLQKGSDDNSMSRRLHYRRGTLSSGNLNLFYQIINMPNSFFEGRHCSCFFKDVGDVNTLEKIVWNKAVNASAHEMLRNRRDPPRIIFQHHKISFKNLPNESGPRRVKVNFQFVL